MKELITCTLIILALLIGGVLTGGWIGAIMITVAAAAIVTGVAWIIMMVVVWKIIFDEIIVPLARCFFQ